MNLFNWINDFDNSLGYLLFGLNELSMFLSNEFD